MAALTDFATPSFLIAIYFSDNRNNLAINPIVGLMHESDPTHTRRMRFDLIAVKNYKLAKLNSAMRGFYQTDEYSILMKTVVYISWIRSTRNTVLVQPDIQASSGIDRL